MRVPAAYSIANRAAEEHTQRKQRTRRTLRAQRAQRAQRAHGVRPYYGSGMQGGGVPLEHRGFGSMATGSGSGQGSICGEAEHEGRRTASHFGMLRALGRQTAGGYNEGLRRGSRANAFPAWS